MQQFAVKFLLGLFGALVTSGCASLNERHYKLRYSNGYASEYCPTSGIVLIGTTTGVATNAITSATVATGVGLGVMGFMYLLTETYEKDCSGPPVSKHPQK